VSAYVVPKEHVDLLVAVAIHGPSEAPTVNMAAGVTWFDVPGDQLRAGAHAAYEMSGLEGYWDFIAEHRRSSRDIDPDALGQLLVNENVRSVLHRYPEAIDSGEVPGPAEHYWERLYRFRRRRYRPTAVEALKAVRCYVYQACEHDEWETSEAKQFCDALAWTLVRSLAGYEEAPWAWDEHEVASRR
jgi:hypothetical protein